MLLKKRGLGSRGSRGGISGRGRSLPKWGDHALVLSFVFRIVEGHIVRGRRYHERN